MNVNALFINRPAPRTESPSRSDAPPRNEYSPRSDDATGSESVSRNDSASRNDRTSRSEDVARSDERAEARKSTKPSPAEFSALLALLAGAGPQVRAELQAQVSNDRAALIDSLLDGGLSLSAPTDWVSQADGYVEATTGDIGDMQTSPSSATDSLRYGMLNEGRAKGIDNALNAVIANSGRPSDDHVQEVLSRIASRHAATADQLKARGDNKSADLRIALDNLLAQAGTPSGLEIASAITANNGAADHAALAAAAAALAAATGASSDVTTPVRDTSVLQPELQQRLDRVIARMKNEFGHDVQVVETARTQERQDFLFEQGRTRPGAIVTWTRDSAHSRGAAVDVTVDGSWNNAEGFARLQRIAQEEGLRTLGAKDPGHLELESSSIPGGQQIAAAVRDAKTQQAASNGAAQAAGRAGVAQVAGVASVAQVAAPGSSSGAPRGYARGIERSDALPESTAPAVAIAGPASANGQGNAFGRGPRDEEGKPLNDGRKLGIDRRESRDGSETPAFGSMQGNNATTTPLITDPTVAPAKVNRAEHVSDVQALRESAPAGEVSRLTLNIDAADGGQDRITVDLRGSSVNTQINTDVASAERLRMRTAELQDALGRHGLESESVRVAGTARAEATDSARLTVGERDALRVGVAQNAASNDSLLNQGQRDRAANAREWDRPDTSRQARDERRESARQGAGQSDQRETPYRSAR